LPDVGVAVDDHGASLRGVSADNGCYRQRAGKTIGKRL
jgi:hypothetical protein